MQKLKGPEINVAARAIDKAFEESAAAVDGIVAYVRENMNEPALVTDPKFKKPYLRVQQIMRSGWSHGTQMDSIVDAARGFASATEIGRVQDLFDFWNGSPQQFIDKVKADLHLSKLKPDAEGGSRSGGDSSPEATP